MSRHLKFVSFPLLAATLLIGCSDSAPPPGLPPAITAFADSENIYYLDTQKNLLKQIMNGGYHQARLSPDKTKVACVYENDIFATIISLNGNLEVEGKPKTVYNSQALSSGTGQGKSYYPTWSADGNKLFFINTNHLVAYDYTEKHTTILFDFPETQSAGLLPESGNMALSKDGSALYCMLGQGTDKYAFWRIDASGSQESQLGVGHKSSVSGFHFPAELSDECIETLFGSREKPVWDPAVSNDGRYYFYVESETGPLAKRLLKGYDRTQKTGFDVLNLGTTLFK